MLIGCDLGMNWGAIWLAGGALGCVLFSIACFYNQLIGWMERHHLEEGYTAFLVAGGVLLTLLAIAILSWQAAVIALFFFVCSGLPMIVGSVLRYGRARELGRKLLAELYTHGSKKTP